MKTSLGVSNVSFGVSPDARAVLNSVFLHHCVEAGLDLAMVNPNHITPYAEIPENERELTDDLVFNRREDALERFIAHFESKGDEAEDAGGPTRPRAWSPRRPCTGTSCAARRTGVEDWIDRSNEKIGAVPTLNTVLLPAMKEVGDKFGAGELILPFVLQSAEVMKRAVAQLENYLDRIEGHTKGKVVIATVFGDVHDIGKSLVNTILTNNGYTVVDLGKQVPVDTIINAAVEHEGRRDRPVRAARVDLEADADLRPGAARARARVPGADRRRRDQPRLRPPHPLPGGKDSDEIYEPGVFYCKDAFQGLDTMDALVDDDARAALVEKIRDEARDAAREAVEVGRRPARDRRQRRARPRAPTRRSPSRRSGARARSRSTSTTSTRYLDRHVLFKLHWGGRGKKGEEWRKIVEGDGDDEGFAPKLERMWREQDYLHPRARLGYFPCNCRRQRAGDLRPRGPRPGDRAARLPAPAQARPHLPGRLLPPARFRASATSSRSRA